MRRAARRGRGSRGRRSRAGSRARASTPTTARSCERERRVARAGGGEHAGDPVDALRVGDDVVGRARRRAARAPSAAAAAATRLGALAASRCGPRGAATAARSPSRAASSAPRRYAARQHDRARRRFRGGRSRGAERASTTPASLEHLERARLAFDVELVARLPPEGAPPVGADLRADAERRAAARRPGAPTAGLARSRWSATSPRPSRCSRPAKWKSAESSASRSHSRAGAIAGELGADVLRERHASSSSRRRLYSSPSEPYEPSPSAPTTRWHGTNEREAVRARRPTRPRAGRSGGRRAPRARRRSRSRRTGSSASPPTARPLERRAPVELELDVVRTSRARPAKYAAHPLGERVRPRPHAAVSPTGARARRAARRRRPARPSPSRRRRRSTCSHHRRES